MGLKEANLALIEKLYVEDGLSMRAIGEKLGLARTTIFRKLHEQNIVTRHSTCRNCLRTGENHPNWDGGLRLDPDGYVNIMQHGHPRANRYGYVRRSIINWEEANDKPFPEDKFPHHINGDSIDDRPENILPVTSSEHAKIHHLGRQSC